MAKGKQKGPPRARRAAAKRPQVLVFVEGAKTEDGYFKEWKRHIQDKVILNIDEYTGADPKALVERAAAEKRSEAREARRGRGGAHDEIWCVFDVDEHVRLQEALDMATANGINVALSNPCFELWLVLHYQDQRAHLERDEARRLSEGLLGCGKVLSPKALGELLERHDLASERAKRLDDMHHKNASPVPNNNPSSGVWRLIEWIRVHSDSETGTCAP